VEEVLFPVLQTGRYFFEMSQLRGKRSAGQSESRRDSPRMEYRKVVPKVKNGLTESPECKVALQDEEIQTTRGGGGR